MDELGTSNEDPTDDTLLCRAIGSGEPMLVFLLWPAAFCGASLLAFLDDTMLLDDWPRPPGRGRGNIGDGSVAADFRDGRGVLELDLTGDDGRFSVDVLAPRLGEVIREDVETVDGAFGGKCGVGGIWKSGIPLI